MSSKLTTTNYVSKDARTCSKRPSWGRSRGTTICPHGVSREFGPSAIAQSRHGSVNSPARCGPRRRKRSGNSGGTCATCFAPEAHVRRQVRIGRYIVDFACHARRIVIEVDGGQHGVRSAADDDRTRILEANGYRVLRYWNNDVLSNINGVLEDILSAINDDPRA